MNDDVFYRLFTKEVERWPFSLQRSKYTKQYRLNLIFHIHLYKTYIAGRLRHHDIKYCVTKLPANMCIMPLELRRFILRRIQWLEDRYLTSLHFEEEENNEYNKDNELDYGDLIKKTEIEVKRFLTYNNEDEEKIEHSYFLIFFKRYYERNKESSYISLFDLCKETALHNRNLLCFPHVVRELEYSDLKTTLDKLIRELSYINNRKQQLINENKLLNAPVSEQENIQVLSINNNIQIDICSPNAWIDCEDVSLLMHTIINRLFIQDSKTILIQAIQRCLLEFAKEIDEKYLSIKSLYKGKIYHIMYQCNDAINVLINKYGLNFDIFLTEKPISLYSIVVVQRVYQYATGLIEQELKNDDHRTALFFLDNIFQPIFSSSYNFYDENSQRKITIKSLTLQHLIEKYKKEYEDKYHVYSSAVVNFINNQFIDDIKEKMNIDEKSSDLHIPNLEILSEENRKSNLVIKTEEKRTIKPVINTDRRTNSSRRKINTERRINSSRSYNKQPWIPAGSGSPS